MYKHKKCYLVNLIKVLLCFSCCPSSLLFQQKVGCHKLENKYKE